MKSMKTKLLVLMLLMGFGSQLAFAGDHSSCVIKKLGVFPSLASPALSRSGYPIFLSCSDIHGSDQQVMYFLGEDMGNPGLATALTAFALNKSVWVRITSDAPGGLISVMYLSQ